MPAPKFPREQVEFIRSEIARGAMTRREAQRALGCSLETINRMVRGDTYVSQGEKVPTAAEIAYTAADVEASAAKLLAMQAASAAPQAPSALDLFLAATAKAKSDARAGDDFIESLLASERAKPASEPSTAESAPKTSATEPGGPPADESEF